MLSLCYKLLGVDMKIKYAGPKVMFTKHGIEFDNNKDDKYVYINIAIQLYQAFDHEYKPNEQYIYDTSTKRLTEDQMMTFAKKNFENFDELVKDAQQKAVIYYDSEMAKVENLRESLEDIEYHTWIKNIELMKSYVEQRQFNKSIYYAIISAIGKNIKKYDIKNINVPMYQSFMHVLNSIAGVLKMRPEPKDSKMQIYEKDGSLIIELDVK